MSKLINVLLIKSEWIIWPVFHGQEKVRAIVEPVEVLSPLLLSVTGVVFMGCVFWAAVPGREFFGCRAGRQGC